jgi:lipopolysaccharide transport system ATP-binding protein
VVNIQGRVTSMLNSGLGMDFEATGLQNIYNVALLRMVRRSVIKERVDSIVEFSDIGAFINLPVKTYSAGMVARLTFAIATELEADILVLDEWLGAGDAGFHEKAAARMKSFVDKARVVVIASHDPALVRNVCNKGVRAGRGSDELFRPDRGVLRPPRGGLSRRWRRRSRMIRPGR